MKRAFFTALTCLSLLSLVHSQSAQPLRVEIPVKAGANPVNFIPFGENGLCLFYPTRNDVGKDSISWSFVMLDKNLNESWRKLIPMHEDVNYLKGFARGKVIYLLFHDTQRKSEENIHVLFIYPALKIITEHKSSIPDRAEVADFEILDDLALIGYNLRKGKPGMIGFSLMNGEKRTFDFADEDNTLLLDIAADTIYNDIYAAFKQQPSSNRNRILLNIYNSSSALRRTINFENNQEKKIINSASIVITGEGKGFVAGAYGSGTRNRRNYDYYNDYYNYYYYNSFYRRQMYQDANQDNTPVSDGYYTAVFDQSEKGTMQYFSFIDFPNAYKYINDPDALRTKRRADRRSGSESQEGSESDREFSLDYRLIAHPIYYSGGQYLFLSEAYIPEYHTMTQMVYDYYGRAIPSTYSVFDGYRYTNAFIGGFDSTGKMKWGNGMEMRDILTNYLNRKVNFYQDGDEIILFYNANSKIASRVIRENDVVDGTTLAPVAQKRSTDQYISEYLGTIEHWYGDYFLASGYEAIRNNSLDESRKNIFYLSKMAFR